MTRFHFSHTFYLTAAIVGVMFAFLCHRPNIKISTSVVPQTFRKAITITDMRSLRSPNLNHNEQQYQIQVFSRDPLVIFIRSFLNSEEIAHLLQRRYVFSVDDFSFMTIANQLRASLVRVNTSHRRSTSATMKARSILTCTCPSLHM